MVILREWRGGPGPVCRGSVAAPAKTRAPSGIVMATAMPRKGRIVPRAAPRPAASAPSGSLPAWIANLPAELRAVVTAAPSVSIPESRNALIKRALGGAQAEQFEVVYDTPGLGRICEA